MTNINQILKRWLNGDALDESLEQHDKKYHGGHFDPKTMSCGKREEMAKEDNPDTALYLVQKDETNGGDSAERFSESWINEKTYEEIAHHKPADYDEFKKMADFLFDEDEDNGKVEADRALTKLKKRNPEFAKKYDEEERALWEKKEDTSAERFSESWINEKTYEEIAHHKPADYDEYKEMADFLFDQAEDNGGLSDAGMTEEDADLALEDLKERNPEFAKKFEDDERARQEQEKKRKDAKKAAKERVKSEKEKKKQQYLAAKRAFRGIPVWTPQGGGDDYTSHVASKNAKSYQEFKDLWDYLSDFWDEDEWDDALDKFLERNKEFADRYFKEYKDLYELKQKFLNESRALFDSDGMDAAAKRYLALCQDAESLRAQNSGKSRKMYPYAARKHADGSVCKAASPETCPFNKKAEKAETEITGKERSFPKVKGIDDGKLKELGDSLQKKGYSSGYVKKILGGVDSGSDEALSAIRGWVNEFMYTPHKDTVSTLWDLVQDNNEKRSGAKSKPWSDSYEDEVNNPNNPKYDAFYGM